MLRKWSTGIGKLWQKLHLIDWRLTCNLSASWIKILSWITFIHTNSLKSLNTFYAVCTTIMIWFVRLHFKPHLSTLSPEELVVQMYEVLVVYHLVSLKFRVIFCYASNFLYIFMLCVHFKILTFRLDILFISFIFT